MSVKRCQDEVDSREFAEWVAYYEIRPFGEEVEDFRAAIGPLVTASVHSSKGQKPKLTDFYPSYSGKNNKRSQSISDMRMVFENFALMHNKLNDKKR